MKRADEILLLLNKSPGPQSASDVAAACGTEIPNINGALQSLVAAELVVRDMIHGVWMYSITEQGVAKVIEPGFGTEATSIPRNTSGPRPVAKAPVNLAAPSQKADVEAQASFGIFTTGEMHIDANGKKVVLTKNQARALSEFICALPNRLFSEAPQKLTMQQLTGTQHRALDNDDD